MVDTKIRNKAYKNECEAKHKENNIEINGKMKKEENLDLKCETKHVESEYVNETKHEESEYECAEKHIHYEVVEEVKREMPKEEDLYDLAELFKVFGDSSRIRILFVLFGTELCVCDLAETLSMTQSAVSHQLKILKQNKLVKFRREGKSIYYSLADEHVKSIIYQGLEHIEED